MKMLFLLVAPALAQLKAIHRVDNRANGFFGLTFLVPPDTAPAGLFGTTRTEYHTEVGYNGDRQPLSISCARDCRVTLKAGGLYVGSWISPTLSYGCAKHNDIIREESGPDFRRDQLPETMRDTDGFCRVRIIVSSLVRLARSGGADLTAQRQTCETVPTQDRMFMPPIPIAKEMVDTGSHVLIYHVPTNLPLSFEKRIYPTEPVEDTFPQELYCFRDCSCTVLHPASIKKRLFICHKSSVAHDEDKVWFDKSERVLADQCQVQVNMQVRGDISLFHSCTSLGPV